MNDIRRVVAWASAAALAGAAALAAGAGCQQPRGAGFWSDVTTSPRPWTHQAFRNDPDAFQFAIVSNRTGGCRPGVFGEAVRKLNLLQPEFVISVGDLIEGYTSDERKLTRQWEAFCGFTERLQMPFFYVPGNHDLSNATMDAVWRRRFGRAYYAFRYRDVLFLCLNSLEREGRYGGLSGEQLAWARRTLGAHRDARWTFVFMHYPLWVHEMSIAAAGGPTRGPSVTGFPELQKALAGRGHTVFAGHFHRYTRFERQGQRYYILATTGGGSELSGPQTGQFDHVVWVTMTEDGPRIANLSLDGIWPEDVYTEEHLRFARGFQVRVLEVSDRPHLRLTFQATADNPFDRPAQGALRWRVPAGSRWRVRPDACRIVVQPESKRTMNFVAELRGGPADISPLPRCTGEMTLTGAAPVKAAFSLPIEAVEAYCRRHRPQVRCGPAAARPTIDGRLDDACWRREPDVDELVDFRLSAVPEAGTQWWLAHDRKHLYLAARCAEPNLAALKTDAAGRDDSAFLDDSVEVFLDADADRKSYHQVVVNAAGVIYDGAGTDRTWDGEHAAATGRQEQAWTVEIAIPWRTLGIERPKPGSRLGLLLGRNRPHSRRAAIHQWPISPKGHHQPTLFADVLLTAGD
jgi:hypothetical protein